MEKGEVFECPPPVLNWYTSMDQTFQLDSALSSIVSSPRNPHPPPLPHDSGVIRELLGRLGSICNAGNMDISPTSYRHMGNSASTCCYNAPLNSPPKLNPFTEEHHRRNIGVLPSQRNPVAQSAPDRGFTERAARLSCFGGRRYGGLESWHGLPPEPDNRSLNSGGSQMEKYDIPSKLQEVSKLEAEIWSKFSTGPSSSSSPDDAETGGAPVQSRATGPRGANEGNARKRKAVPTGKANDIPMLSSAVAAATATAGDQPKVEEDESNSKRSKWGGDSYGAGKDKDNIKPKVEQDSDGSSGQKPVKGNHSKPSEHPKQDYIHVRARRGQATDSHSLAERVRREKISERMKFLQDLVPGCSKVTGKAFVLDEIINYVQSLQRQVEFLSMKLAMVNPQLDVSVVESLLLLPKNMHQPPGSLPDAAFPLEASACAFPDGPQHQHQGTSLENIGSSGLEDQFCLNPLDATHCQLPSIDFTNTCSQIGAPWEDDLHRWAFPCQSFHAH